MRVGIPAEVKNHEYRVGLTPAGVDALRRSGHEVVVQSEAGRASGCADEDYAAAGADIVPSAEQAWAADMVLKVKEPVREEYGFLRPGLLLFTYLHLAADKPLTSALLDAETTSIAYETVRDQNGLLPLLTPMSEVAGRLAALEGAAHLKAAAGGRGILLSGAPGTAPGKAVVIGGGVAGENAARVAQGLGAEVTVLDISPSRLRELDARYRGAIQTRLSTAYEIAEQVADADLVVGSVLIPGAAAPKLVTKEMISSAKPGTVFVDVAIDQGGCFEGSVGTTHDAPTFSLGDAVMYCVTNMPGAVPATSTAALTNATLPYVLKLAQHGWEKAVETDPGLASGLSTAHGVLRSREVAAAHGLPM
ncbi:alanine dehydrogenase [Nesterenkonia populi]|uniref:alanine dehydrogenase n=1 Tax=Nesterenkonia populi TaxID=1591087 RepID=UPI0011BEB2E9|nr:alanine dehydrogenase [Nesterenkonia populi]